MTLPFDQTLGLSHPFSVGKNVHSILGNPNAAGTFYADIAARDADTAFQVLENVGKAVGITSPLSIFVLMSTGPSVWLELGTADPVDTFLELTDVFETTYTGFALNAVRVNAAETGLEFTTDDAGNVINVGVSTDNALARFDLATGKLIQNSLGILDDAGALSGLTQLNVDNLQLNVDTLSNTGGNSVILESLQLDTAIVRRASPGTTLLAFDNDGLITGKVGDYGGGIDLGGVHAQIGWGTTGGLFLAPTSDGAGDIELYTPNAGLSSLVERMRIKTSTGNALFGSAMSVGALTDSAASTSIDLKSTTAALLFNRLTTTQRDAIPIPLAGMGIWNTTTDQMENFDGVAWVPMGGGDVSGPATNTDNSIPVWNGVNSKTLKDSPHTVDPTTGKLLFDVSESVVARFRMDAGSGVASLINIEDTSVRLQFGYFGTTGLSQGAGQAQIGASLNGAVQIASRGNFAGGGIQFITPNAALDTLIERMRIVDGTGDVGIGILTPTSKLDIRGAPVTDTFIRVGDSFVRMQLGFRALAGVDGNSTYSQIQDAAGDLCFSTRTDSDRDMVFFTGDNSTNTGIERMRLIGGTAAQGKLGIGISTPDSRLHVHLNTAGSVSPLGGTVITMENSGDNYLSFLAPAISTHGLLFGFPGGGQNNIHGGIFYDVTNGFQFRNNLNTNRVCIEQNGRVGIGTTTPDALFHLRAASSGAVAGGGGITAIIESNINNFLQFLQPNASGGGLIFGDVAIPVAGAFSYTTTDDFLWSTVNNIIRMSLNTTGLRIGDTALPTAGLDVQGSHANSRTAIADANHTVVAADYLLAITSITAARTIDFPTTEIAKTGKEWPIKDESGSVDGTDTITLTTGGSETIDGATSLVLNTAFFDLVIYTNGTNLFVRSA